MRNFRASVGAKAGTLSLSAASYSANELATLSVTVTRTVSYDGDVAVDWVLSGLSEGAPAVTSGTLRWDDQESSSKTISLTFTSVTANRSGTLTLSNPRVLRKGKPPSLGTSSATVTVQNATGVTSLAVDHAAVFCAGQGVSLSFGGENTPFPSIYPLELIYPRAAGSAPSTDAGTPTFPSTHRIFKAYPGIEYNIRATAIGGSYPYTWTLSGQPSGMTIDESTGEISWTPAAGLNGTTTSPITIRVTDSEGNFQQSTWTITVSTTGHYFLDASASPGGDGTEASPWRDLSDFYDAGNTVLGGIIWFKNGSYSLAGCASNEVATQFCRANYNRNQANNWVAYPGHTPVIDYHARDAASVGVFTTWDTTYNCPVVPTISWDDVFGGPIYWDGLSLTDHPSKGMLFYDGHYATFRNCRWYQMNRTNVPSFGGSNAGMMSFTDIVRYYTVIDGCSFDDTQTITPVKYYGIRKHLMEYCTQSGNDQTLGWKDNMWRSTFRRNQIVGIGGNQDSDNASYRTGGEICYNFFNAGASSSAFGLGAAAISQIGNIYAYRNTIIGRVDIIHRDGTDGTWVFSNNVVQNDESSLPTPHIDVSGTVTMSENLTGASGLVDTSGNLTGLYIDYLGSRGWEIP